MKTAVTLSISLFLALIVPLTGTAQEGVRSRSFQFDNVALRASLDSLMKWYPESIVYLDNDVEGKTVSGSCTRCVFDEALSTILRGSSLTWVRLGNQVILKRQDQQVVQRLESVSGVVVDSVTGESIVGATVLLQDSVDMGFTAVRRMCSTNDFGFFSLPDVSPGSRVLVIRALGYESVRRNIGVAIGGNLEYNIEMIPKEILMQEVTVEGRRTALTSAEGISRGVYHRSAPTDQNQYILDGGRVYNPTHFGGVLSTFSPEALNDVQIAGGGLPPSYGGRLGGIVDLSVRNGTRAGLSGSAGLGTLGSTLALEGPFSGSTTFLASGRSGYPGATMEYLHSGQAFSQQRFSELMGKVNHRLSGSAQVSVCGFLGMDSYSNEVDGIGKRLTNDLSWDNRMLSVRWIGIASPSLFLHASACYSRYGFNLEHALMEGPSFFNGTRFSSDYGIEDFTLRANAEGYYDEDHTVRAGIELVHHNIQGNINSFSSQAAPLSIQTFSAWEASLYLQDQWRILPRISAELGGRATTFLGDKATFSSVDPRFSLIASLDERTRLYCSFSAINQFIHPYHNSGVFLLYPTIFWYPSNDKVRPSTSLHFNLGVQTQFGDDAYFASAESYYRTTNNLHEVGLDSMYTAAQDLNNSILFGTGRTYGITCTFQKRLGDLTGTVNYILSWTYESFTEINGGNAFSPPFDRRHEVQLSARYEIGGNWMLGALCVITSGQSSLPAPRVVPAAEDKTRAFLTNIAPYGDFLDVNGSRLPGFERLEFSAIWRIALRDVPIQLSFRLLNSYGLIDPFVWKLQRSTDTRSMWSATLKEPSLVPLYPAVGLAVRF